MHVRTPGLLVVHLMMVRWSAANSSSGPFLIWTRSAFLTGGSTCAVVDVLVRGGRETDDPSRVRRLASCYYGMGGLGNGATPQIADAQDGSGGVGMRNSFPWVDAVPPNMHVPVNVSRLGNGVVNPSVRVCRKATIWFYCRSVKARLPVVMSRLFLTSGIGQQFTFSTVPGGQCPDVTGKANRSRVL